MLPQRCLLVHFEAALDFSRSESLAHNNISQICYWGQIPLQSAVVNCSFSDNLAPFGVTFILPAMVHTYTDFYIYIYIETALIAIELTNFVANNAAPSRQMK